MNLPTRGTMSVVVLTVCLVLGACSQEPPEPESGAGNLTGLRTGPPMDEPEIEPITGYGDYSDVDFLLLDATEVTADIARCMNDQGLAVRASGNSLSFERVPQEQLDRAEDVASACEAGLQLPQPRELTRDEFELRYERQLAVAECLDTIGLPTSEPPSLDTWISDYATGPWHAYEALPRDPGALSQATTQCPEHPPGGYSSWRPGDPVRPAGS